MAARAISSGDTSTAAGGAAGSIAAAESTLKSFAPPPLPRLPMVKRIFVVCSQKENYFELFNKITLKSGEAIEVDQAPWMDIEVHARSLAPPHHRHVIVHHLYPIIMKTGPHDP